MALSTEPTYISGIGETNLIQSSRRMVDIPDEIFYLEQEDTPLIYLARGRNMPNGMTVKQRPSINPEFKVLTKKPHGNWMSVSATTVATTGDLTINVAQTPSMCRVGMVVQVPATGEQLRLTTYSTSGLTIGVLRGYGATTAKTIPVKAPLQILHPASMEADTAPEIKSVKAGVATNYCSILRHAFGASQTAIHSELYGGPIMGDNEKEAWLEFKKEWERGLIFAEPKEDLTNYAHPLRVSGGIVYWIKQGDSTTQTDTAFSSGIKDFMRTLFRYGKKEKILLCSPDVIDHFEKAKETGLRFEPSSRFYDLRTAQWNSGHGTGHIMRDVILEDSPYGATTAGNDWGGTIIGIDPDDIRLRHLKGRDVKLNKGPGGRGIQANDSDSIEYEYIGELGLELDNPDKHRIWTGITGYS